MAVLHLDMVNNGICKMLESSRRRTLLDVVSNGVKIKRYIVIRKCPWIAWLDVEVEEEDDLELDIGPK